MGMTLAQLAAEKQNEYKDEIILANVNGKLKELGEEYIPDSDVTFVTTSTSIGNETYRRSVVLLMLAAIDKIDRNIDRVVVEYSLSKGLYCTFDGDFRPDKEFIDEVKSVMHSMVEKDLPIKKELMKISDAMNLFKEKGMTDKTSLFKYRRSSFVNVYDLNGYKDYFYGYMASSTGMLGVFDIFLYDEGIVLQLPVKNAPLEVPEFNPQTKLFNVLKESTSWAKMLGMSTVGELNDHITNGDMTSFMLTQEALQEQKIVEIVDEIKKRPHTKFIMIAGPSSSGKTTFSHRLSIQLMANGYKPHPIAVDNYFVEREQTPIDENGDYNYEDLHAVYIELFNKHMTRLLNGEKVELPEFNFKFGRKEYNGNFLQLGEEDVLVIEGIHCLNDELSYSLPIDSKFKIYISALTQLNVDEHNRVSTTDGRLLRRLVRDYRTRGASAKKTLSMWESVRRGEEKNIFPFQEQADVMFNSAMPYEPCVLKPFVEPILFQVTEADPEYQEANRLLKFMNYFLPCGYENVPIDSILREFVGGGCFKV